MKTLYIVSQQQSAGKSAFCAGLGRRLQRRGLNIGYMKPVSTQVRHMAGRIIDQDAELIRRLFELRSQLDQVAPVLLDDAAIEEGMREWGPDRLVAFEKAFQSLQAGKDIMLLEGGQNLAEGTFLGMSAPQIAAKTGAKSLLVGKYENDLVVDCILATKEMMGDDMLGCVINMVPSGRVGYAEEVLVPFLKARGVPVFAVFPSEPVLMSVTVQELADALGGEALCANSCMDELVEDVMIGAMSVESALRFFRRRANKAVITGGDRPDIQLAALETSTKCLILTGNLHPSPIILERANEMGVPMILVKQDTVTAMEITDRFFGRSRFHQEQKLVRFEELFNELFDFEAFCAAFELE